METSMSTSKTHPIPDGPRLIPYLSVKEAARAIEFYGRAFGAVEVLRLVDPGGRVSHAELAIGEARLMLADEHPEIDSVGPQTLGGTSVSLTVYVEDVDALVERAITAGAKLLRPVTDEFYGDRVALLRDPFGHKWGFQSRIEHVSPEEMQRRFTALMQG
jgi:PhnB protein